MMFCTRLEPSLIALAFKEMDETSAKCVWEHVQSCARCARVLKEYELLYEVVHTGVEVPDCSPSMEKLRETLLGRGLQKNWKQSKKWRLALACASLVSVVLVLVGLDWMRSQGSLSEGYHASGFSSAHVASAQPEFPGPLISEKAGPEPPSPPASPELDGSKRISGESFLSASARAKPPVGKSPSLRGQENVSPLSQKTESVVSVPELAIIFVDFDKSSSEGTKTAVELSGEDVLSFGS